MDWFQANLSEILNGFMLLVFGILAWVGKRFGSTAAPAHEGEPMELAGAVIDQKQAEAIVVVVSANTEALKEQTVRMNRAAEAIGDLEDEVRNLRQEIFAQRRVDPS